MRTHKFIRNITEQIKEAQMKLGYAKESLRLYYPVQTLNGMLCVSAKDVNEMLNYLQAEEFQNTELGKLTFSARKDRIEVGISADGAEYVHKNVEEPKFLKDLIEFFRNNHHCTISEVEELFKKHSDTYVCQKMPEGSDFDVVYYFEDFNIDMYYYCIKEEMGHTIYHRFSREDMVELLKDEY